MESLACDRPSEQTVSVAEIIQKVRSEIVSVRDSVVGCYECVNDCAVDHVTVRSLDNALVLLDTLKE